MTATATTPTKYAGADWIRAALENQYGRPVALSPLGEQVADILGHMYRGIYHIERAALHERVDWTDRHCIRVVIGRELSNVDGAELTDLVMGCADLGIRLAIHAAARGYLELVFTAPGIGMWYGRLRRLVFADAVQELTGAVDCARCGASVRVGVGHDCPARGTDAQPARLPGGAS